MKLFTILLSLLLTGCISYSHIYEKSKNGTITGKLHNYIDHTSKLSIIINDIECESPHFKFSNHNNFTGNINCNNSTSGTFIINMYSVFAGDGSININNDQINFIIN